MKRHISDDDSKETSRKRNKVPDEEEIPSGIPAAAGPEKTRVPFSISEFRSQLKSSNALKYLRDFANCAEWGTSSNDVVMDYLRAGGSVGEITSLLDVTAQGDLATAMPVFRAVFLILLKIQGEASEFKSAARHDAENLLSSFVPAFQGMISINSPKNRKVVLKLLASLVALQPSFGRQIINWFSLTPTQLESFVEPGAVRKAFVMFLMSFFFEGNVSTFRPLLDKKGLLSSILPNLKFDDVDTVVLVLNVLTEKMLLNPKLAKTVKLNIFNTQAIQCLFQLFDWVGPKGVSKGWKKRTKKQETDPESAAAVKMALTRLLHVLGTDKKHGIVFVDKALGVTAQLNQLILTALEAVPKPWKIPEISGLVRDILINSPDVIKVCLNKWGASFEPRDSEAWSQSVNFLIEIQEGIDPEKTIPGALESLTPSQMHTGLMGILLNPNITKHLQSSQEDSQPIQIRCQGLVLLRTILCVLQKFLDVLRKASYFGTIKKYFIQQFSSILPDISGLCQMWQGKNADYPAKRETIARFLLEVARFEPTLIQDKPEICKMFIKNVIASHDDVQLTSDVLQIVCLLDSSFISPSNKRFRSILDIAFKLSCHSGEDCISPLAHMIRNTSLFDDTPGHLDVWLHSWKCFADESSTNIAEILANAVMECLSEGTDGTFLLMKVIEKSKAAKDECPESQFERNRQFITFLLLHLGCMPNFDHPPESAELLVLNIEKCLKGNIASTKKKVPLLNPQLAFIRWLHGIDDMDLEAIDGLECPSVIVILLHFIRMWMENGQFFSSQFSSSRCIVAFDFLKKKLCPKVLPVEWKPNDYFLRSDPCALFAKLIDSFFTEKALIRAFYICDDEFLSWAKESVRVFGLDAERTGKYLPKDILSPWRKRLFKSIQKHISSSNETIELASEFPFWLSFFKPSEEELTGIFESLCNIPPETAATSSSIGFIWSSIVQALRSGTMSLEWMEKIVRSLCAVVLLSSNTHFHSALYKMLSNQALLVMFVPNDFVRGVIGREGDIDDSLIRAAVVCTESWPTKDLVNFIQSSAEIMNGRMAIALIGSLLNRKGLQFSSLCSVTKLMEKIKQEIGWKIPSAIRAIVKWAEPFIVKFVTGKEDAIISENKLVLNLLLFEIEAANPTCIVQLAENDCVILDALPSLVTLLAAKNSNVSSLLAPLIVDPKEPESWEAKADAVEFILRDDELVKEFVALRTSRGWKKFANKTLRNLSLNNDHHRWKILHIVTDRTWTKGADNSELADLFIACTSHQDFIPLMLSSSPVKDEVLGLILSIVRLWPNVMLLNHIPLFLAAYSAQLTVCDQRLLQILSHYEAHLGSLSKFEPFFWGQPAVTHYSVRNGGGLSLWKQISMKSVLELLDVEKMLNTVANFPITRKLKDDSIVDEETIYDPSFLLPLFSKLLSPGAVPYCLSFVHKGGLSLCIAALSSRDVGMRNAAALVLSRFYAHLQLSQHTKQKPVWLHIIDCIRFGLDNLTASPMCAVVSVFWARAVMEVSDAQAPLYSLHKLLLAKPSANLKVVPEFVTLFFSQDVNHAAQRKWILTVIRDGIRHEDDVMLLLKSSVTNVVLTYYSASYATNDIKIIILQIFDRIFRVGLKCEGLLEELGLDAWLRVTITEVKGNLVDPFKQLLLTTIRHQNEWQKIHGRVVNKPAITFLDAALLRLTSISSKKLKHL